MIQFLVFEFLEPLYNTFKDNPFDAKELETEITKLMQDVDNKKDIYYYVLTREEKHLNIRAFSYKQKREAYDKQKGIYAVCQKPFKIEYMEADHIIPWEKGGQTIASNCQMLCQKDNSMKDSK